MPGPGAWRKIIVCHQFRDLWRSRCLSVAGVEAEVLRVDHRRGDWSILGVDLCFKDWTLRIAEQLWLGCGSGWVTPDRWSPCGYGSMWSMGGTRNPSRAHIGPARRMVIRRLRCLWGSRTRVMISTGVENWPLQHDNYDTRFFLPRFGLTVCVWQEVCSSMCNVGQQFQMFRVLLWSGSNLTRNGILTANTYCWNI